jgi:hypothetical protein
LTFNGHYDNRKHRLLELRPQPHRFAGFFISQFGPQPLLQYMRSLVDAQAGLRALRPETPSGALTAALITLAGLRGTSPASEYIPSMVAVRLTRAALNSRFEQSLALLIGGVR